MGIHFNCPYCKLGDYFDDSDYKAGMNILDCNYCYKPFVFTLKYNPEVKVYKIENDPKLKNTVGIHKRNDAILKTPIDDVGLSVRPVKILKKMGVNTLDDVFQYSSEDLLKVKGFGRKSLREINEILVSYGLSRRIITN